MSGRWQVLHLLVAAKWLVVACAWQPKHVGATARPTFIHWLVSASA
jgi:hypothetical protein